MEVFVVLPLLRLLFLVNLAASQQCVNEDWTSTFAIAGDSTSQCSTAVSYVNALISQGYASGLQTGPGVIDNVRCCDVNLPYSQESNDCYQEGWWAQP